MISKLSILRTLFSLACLSILALGPARAAATSNAGSATLENSQVLVSVDLQAGIYQAIDKRDGQTEGVIPYFYI